MLSVDLNLRVGRLQIYLPLASVQSRYKFFYVNRNLIWVGNEAMYEGISPCPVGATCCSYGLFIRPRRARDRRIGP